MIGDSVLEGKSVFCKWERSKLLCPKGRLVDFWKIAVIIPTMPLWKMTLPFLSKARAYFPCSELGLDLWLVLMERVLQKWLRLPWMSSSLNMRGHMEEKNWRMQVKQRDREKERGKEKLAASSRFRNPICSPGHVSEIVWDIPTIAELSNAYSFMNDSRRD